jgi:hypothetical protein
LFLKFIFNISILKQSKNILKNQNLNNQYFSSRTWNLRNSISPPWSSPYSQGIYLIAWSFFWGFCKAMEGNFPFLLTFLEFRLAMVGGGKRKG